MKTIKLLDLCCKAGGGSMGYFQAAKDMGLNIEITGVDIEPQPIQGILAEIFSESNQIKN